MPRGGFRPGSGRKPKSLHQHMLDGTAPKGRLLAHPSVPTVIDPSIPVESFDPPETLTAEQRAVWVKQAPHAFENRTLTRATSLAFERYCTIVVLEACEAKSSGVGGANHRGLLKLINDYELQFMLTPNGKPLAAPAAAPAEPANPIAKFRGA